MDWNVSVILREFFQLLFYIKSKSLKNKVRHDTKSKNIKSREPPEQQIIALQRRMAQGQHDVVRQSCISLQHSFPNSIFIAQTLFFLDCAKNDWESALKLAEKVLALSKNNAGALFNKGLALERLGNTKLAIEFYERASSRDPNLIEPLINRGNLLLSLDRIPEAIICFTKAKKVKTNHFGCYQNLALSYMKMGQFEEALQETNLAIELVPDNIEIQNTRGLILNNLKKYSVAIEQFKAILDADPLRTDILQNLSISLSRDGQLQNSLDCLDKCIKINPKNSISYDLKSSILRDQRRFKESVESSNKAVELSANPVEALLNLCMTLNYDPLITNEEMFEYHLKMGAELCSTAGQKFSLVKNKKAARLHIGYVSGDFRQHSVAYFLESVLERHDRSKFEITCYHNSFLSDSMTERLKKSVENWHQVKCLSDDDFGDLILANGVDILVDLSGITRGNRLGVFARKPAPIQVSWLGYPNTTGLDTIDYRLVDEITDPIGADAFYSEKLVRLPGGFNCFTGDTSLPTSDELPVDINGRFTFGSFNNLLKINNQVIQVWSKILLAIPNSRLILKTGKLKDTSLSEKLVKDFELEGVSHDQLKIIQRTESKEDHLALYNQIDLALDTFPFNGATTTCEALWMGVPVVTLLGDRHAGRVGASILQRVGLDQFIAETSDDMVDLAVIVASDIIQLRKLRKSLRSKMLASNLCNGAAMARSIEKAFLKMHKKLI